MTDPSDQTAPSPAPPRVGIWIDEDPATATTDEYVGALASLHLQVVAIMVSGNQGFSADWTPAWTTAQVHEMSTKLRAAGMQVVLTCWPAPDKGYLEQMFAGRAGRPGMADLITAADADGFEVDAETEWTTKHLAGFSSLADAGSYLHDGMRAAAPHASLQLTTYANHAELSAENTVSRYMDVVVPQAYSINTQIGPHGQKVTVHWGDEYAPGNMQVYCAKRAAEIRPASGAPLRLVFGLAAYDQEFADRNPSIHHTPEQAMQEALHAATTYCDEVRYWSASHVFSRGNTYARGFVSSI